MTRVRYYTKAVQEFDKDLFCQRDDLTEKIHIMQKAAHWPGMPHYVCSLTDNWGINGRPVEWGVEPIKARLRAMKLASDGGQEFLREFWAQSDKHEESKQRDFRNNVESFLLDFRKQFARATDGVNVSTLEKTDKRRLGEKNGYC